jgi:N-acylneuraminate cytidylyltransferase
MRTNPQRIIKRASENGFMEMVQPRNTEVRTQDLEEYFYDAGKVYAAKASTWLSAEGILSSPFRSYELPYWEAQDLDEPVDWEIAELMLRGRI